MFQITIPKEIVFTNALETKKDIDNYKVDFAIISSSQLNENIVNKWLISKNLFCLVNILSVIIITCNLFDH